MKVHTHSAHPRTIIGASLLLLSVAGGSIWWIWQASMPTVLNQQTTLRSQEATIPAKTESPRVLNRPQTKELQPEGYWLKDDGQQISLVPRRIALKAVSSSEQALTKGVINLLANSKADGQSSAIPPGTHLLSLRMAPDGIYVNLSREFSQGGGSSSMVYRVAQILYTVTSLDPNAKVYLSVEGKALGEDYPLGGEGLILRQPLTRQQFTKDFSLD
jgi:spore germination protein GerM